MKIGSHVGMSGKEMMLGSVKEALSVERYSKNGVSFNQTQLGYSYVGK